MCKCEIKKIMFLGLIVLSNVESKDLNFIEGIGLVGTDLNCDFSTLQEAYSSGAKEIRVSNQKVYSDNFIIDRPVIIKGGFATCTDASNDELDLDDDGIVEKSTWSGQGLNTVVNIIGNEDNQAELLLTHFKVRDGYFQFAGDAGGIMLSGNAILNLENVDVTANIGDYGGGIGVYGSSASFNIRKSRIFNNEASIGGGLYCKGGQNVTANENYINNTFISANAATSYGGGVSLELNCNLTFSSISPQLSGVFQNTSHSSGGGISLRSGAQLFLLGDSLEYAVSILNNSSYFGAGGGVYLNSAHLILRNSEIRNNSSAIFGGGIHSTNYSTVDFHRGKIFNNRVFGTDAMIDSAAGAVYANNSSIQMKNIHFQNNQSNYYPLGIFSGDQIGNYLFESNLITNHRTLDEDLTTDLLFVKNNDVSLNTGLLQVWNYDDMQNNGLELAFNLIHNTFANNQVDYSVQIEGNGHVKSIIENNIFSDVDSFPVLMPESNNAYIDFTYNALTNNNLEGKVNVNSFGNLVTLDFGFVDPLNSNYQLNDMSPLIDYAERPAFYSNSIDLLLDLNDLERGVDVINDNTYGYYDLGAYEYQGEVVNSDVIFKNSFE